MTKLHTIISAPRSSNGGLTPKAPKTRKAKITEAEIQRCLRAANAAGCTIYAIEFEDGKMRIQTKPRTAAPSAAVSEAEDWLNRNG